MHGWRPCAYSSPGDRSGGEPKASRSGSGRWHRDARRFVERYADELRSMPVWFFSSGPLDDSADKREIAPTGQVSALMRRAGARGHVTFGGRLAPDAHGFIAGAMAKKHAGDFRDSARARAWAAEIAGLIMEAPIRTLPPPPHEPSHPASRALAHAFVGWAACLVTMAALLATTSRPTALALHAIAAPVIFAAVAASYFRGRDTWTPLRAATTFGLRLRVRS